MAESPKPSIHRVRWKGRDRGPYTRDEIRTRLGAGELSLLHRVEVSGRWIGLGEFLSSDRGGFATGAAAREKPLSKIFAATISPTPEERPRGLDRRRAEPPSFTKPEVAYFLCSLCFVFPIFATGFACLSAMKVRSEGDASFSDTLFVIAGTLTMLGLAFWGCVAYAANRGMI